MTSILKPLIERRADPFIYRHTDGTYYFTASVPDFDLIELRRADALEKLPEAEPRVIWQKHAQGPLSGFIWAPEIHFVDGAWYVYFAAAQEGADREGRFDHRVYALENLSPNPMEGAFVEKGRVDTGWASFSLDATTFAHRGKRYFVWAQRDPAVTGNSNLYIARMRGPLALELPAVLLSKPEYPWECRGFWVNEGPAVLIRNGYVFITYSGSATDERYCMGMLTARADADLLHPASWTKAKEPVMATDAEAGIYGPGHNSFTVDGQGGDILVFHARPYPGFRGTPLSDPNRHTYCKPISFDEKGAPVF